MEGLRPAWVLHWAVLLIASGSRRYAGRTVAEVSAELVGIAEGMTETADAGGVRA